jgi:hypothetical protein
MVEQAVAGMERVPLELQLAVEQVVVGMERVLQVAVEPEQEDLVERVKTPELVERAQLEWQEVEVEMVDPAAVVVEEEEQQEVLAVEKQELANVNFKNIHFYIVFKTIVLASNGFPLPSCYLNADGFMCCNRELE